MLCKKTLSIAIAVFLLVLSGFLQSHSSAISIEAPTLELSSGANHLDYTLFGSTKKSVQAPLGVLRLTCAVIVALSFFVATRLTRKALTFTSLSSFRPSFRNGHQILRI